MTVVGIGGPWVASELRVVRKAAIPFEIHALRVANEIYYRGPDIEEMRQRTRYIYPLQRWNVFTSLVAAPYLFRGRFVSALCNSLVGERESFWIRLKGIFHFVVACHWARQMRCKPISRIHSQWIHSAGSVAYYGARLLGVPFSFTGHAADLFCDRSALRDKIRWADFIVCISSFHKDFFLKEGARAEQLELVYCGIDTDMFQPSFGKRLDSITRIASSGRLVSKKGFDTLLNACFVLSKRGINFSCTIAGTGPQENELRHQIEVLGLESFVQLTGKYLLQEDIPAFMNDTDIYCLACQWGEDGDVDGLPIMLMEAMACGVPVISTNLVGIPDLVVDGETGILVPPRDPRGLADALERLISDSALRGKLARNGRKLVQSKFDVNTCLVPLIARFRNSLSFRTEPHRM